MSVSSRVECRRILCRRIVSIMIDRRTIPGETDAGVRREIAALLRRNHLRATLASTKDGPCLPMETSARAAVGAAVMSSIGQRRAMGVDYFCDASVLSQGGIPSIVFGPGDIARRIRRMNGFRSHP